MMRLFIEFEIEDRLSATMTSKTNSGDAKMHLSGKGQSGSWDKDKSNSIDRSWCCTKRMKDRGKLVSVSACYRESCISSLAHGSRSCLPKQHQCRICYVLNQRLRRLSRFEQEAEHPNAYSTEVVTT